MGKTCLGVSAEKSHMIFANGMFLRRCRRVIRCLLDQAKEEKRYIMHEPAFEVKTSQHAATLDSITLAVSIAVLGFTGSGLHNADVVPCSCHMDSQLPLDERSPNTLSGFQCAKGHMRYLLSLVSSCKFARDRRSDYFAL